ncbi:MAG: hypothetical protein AAF497_27880, partial [Planctomycetota bacterium]
MKSLVSIASVVVLIFAGSTIAQQAEEPARKIFIPGEFLQPGNATTAEVETKRAPASRSSVRKKRFMPSAPTA